MKDAESVKIQQQQHIQQYSCTLDQCFQLYTKEEQVVQPPPAQTSGGSRVLIAEEQTCPGGGWSIKPRSRFPL